MTRRWCPGTFALLWLVRRAPSIFHVDWCCSFTVDLCCDFPGESVLQWKARKEHLELKHLTFLSLVPSINEVPLRKDRTVTFFFKSSVYLVNMGWELTRQMPYIGYYETWRRKHNDDTVLKISSSQLFVFFMTAKTYYTVKIDSFFFLRLSSTYHCSAAFITNVDIQICNLQARWATSTFQSSA